MLLSGKYEEAIKQFTHAIEQKPDDPGLYGLRSNSYSKLDLHEKALSDCEKMIELNPKDFKGYLLKGNTLFYMNVLEDALTAYDKAINLATDDNVKQSIEDAIKKISTIY